MSKAQPTCLPICSLILQTFIKHGSHQRLRRGVSTQQLAAQLASAFTKNAGGELQVQGRLGKGRLLGSTQHSTCLFVSQKGNTRHKQLS